MRTLIIVGLMLVTIFSGLIAMTGRVGGCAVAIVTGLLFLILAARNGRKQQQEVIERAVNAARHDK